MESIQEFRRNLAVDMEKVRPDDRLQYLKDRISRLSPDDRDEAESWATCILALNIPPVRGVVIAVVHGIRTDAVWQNQLKAAASNVVVNRDVDVKLIRLGFFDALRFWFPIGLFRSSAVKSATKQLRIIARDYRNSDIVIVAHSFGTYVISRFLKENEDFQVQRILFCGSVVSELYQWDALPNLPRERAVVNDIGTADFWPVLAKTLTFGYGASGVNGFRSPSVANRYHDVAHSGFFTEEIFNEFWLPFLIEGEIVSSEYDVKRKGVPWLWSTCSLFSGQVLILLLVVVAVLYYIFWW